MALNDVAMEVDAPAKTALQCSVCGRRAGITAAFVLLITGVFFVWQGSKLPLGADGVPGAGFFPLLVGAMLAIAASMIAIDQMRSNPSGERIEFGHHDVLVTFAALIGVAVGFEALGAYVTLGLLFIVSLVVIGRVPLMRAAFGSAVSMIAVWYFFKVLLGLQLPSGSWF